MINLKATLKKAKMTGYRLSKELGKERQQIYNWINGKNKLSPLMEEKLRMYFKYKKIDVL